MKIAVLLFNLIIISCVSISQVGAQNSYFNEKPRIFSDGSNPLSGVEDCSKYSHKTEIEIASLSISQKIDEAVKEYVCHGGNYRDDYSDLIFLSLRREGVNAFPELISRLNACYPPATEADERHLNRCFMTVLIVEDFDDRVVRLRGTENGRRTIDSLKALVARMKKGGSSKKQSEAFSRTLCMLQGVNIMDGFVAQTLEKQYNIRMDDRKKKAFSNFLVAMDPSYPSWSEIDEEDVMMLKDHERFYNAYIKFAKQ